MPEKYDINGNPIFSPFELVLTPTLEPAMVTASPVTTRGKYVLAKKNLQAAKEEHKEIKRDIKQYLDENGIFRTDEQIQPFVDRVNNSESIIGSRQDFKKARDAYYSELGNPNGLLPQLYRYWSRHYGYKSKQDEGYFTFGPGADIIDLRSNVQRLTPTSTQSTALFNEFVESKYPSVLSAETYKNSPNRIIGDMSKFPAKNVSIFGGIEDGKFRLDSLKNFDNSTTVIPARNIKSGTPMISSIQIGQEDQPGQSQVYRDWDKIDELWDLRENSLANEGNLLREYWSDPSVQEGIAEEINNLSEGNKYLRGMLESGNNSGPQHRRYIRQGIRHNKQDIKRWNKILMGKMPHYFLFDIMAANHTVAPRYPRPMSEIQTAQYFRDAEPAKYTFTDTNGEQHYVSEYNASVLDGKTVIGNPDGSIFIGKLQDISRPQLDSLNAYLKDNPSWIMRTDLGSFDQYRLDNPSLDTYLKQYYEHPKANDPNVYAVGTTEPNRLWNKANGGFLSRLQKHYGSNEKALEAIRQFKEGGQIHIAPSKKGTFTAAAKKHGKSVQAFASQVLAHKENYSPAMVKKANFARVSAKWHAMGGPIGKGYISVEDPDFVGPVLPVEDDIMIDRQRYAESTYNDLAYNKGSKAQGAFQITPVVYDEYTKRTGKKGDLNDPNFNRAVRDWYMNERLPEFQMYRLGAPSDSNRVGRLYASFNAGPGKVLKALRQAEVNGIDINRGFGFLQYLPKETQDYVNFNVRGKDIPGTSKTAAAQKKARANLKEAGGIVERYGSDAVRAALTRLKG